MVAGSQQHGQAWQNGQRGNDDEPTQRIYVTFLRRDVHLNPYAQKRFTDIVAREMARVPRLVIQPATRFPESGYSGFMVMRKVYGNCRAR